MSLLFSTYWFCDCDLFSSEEWSILLVGKFGWENKVVEYPGQKSGIVEWSWWRFKIDYHSQFHPSKFSKCIWKFPSKNIWGQRCMCIWLKTKLDQLDLICPTGFLCQPKVASSLRIRFFMISLYQPGNKFDFVWFKDSKQFRKLARWPCQLLFMIVTF